ncbi:MAG: hypothetical protein ACI8R9_002669 [Paraglaciecola sp.]|jgi:hypothetical protein
MYAVTIAQQTKFIDVISKANRDFKQGTYKHQAAPAKLN